MPDPIELFIENTKEVEALIALHEEKTGRERGRRHGVEVLNKSAIVLLMACWEAFVEDTASAAFEFVLERTTDANNLPKAVGRKVAVWVKEDKNELRVWDLAGNGWRQVLRSYKIRMLQSYISFFNTPKAGNIDRLFDALLGLPKISNGWSWRHMSSENARLQLAKFVDLRGAIAHRVKSAEPVHKKTVNEYRESINRLAARTANETCDHVGKLTGHFPWPMAKYGSVE